MTEIGYTIPSETESRLVASVAGEISLRIFARHTSNNLVDIRGILDDGAILLSIRQFLMLELRHSIAKTLQPVHDLFQLNKALEAPAFEAVTTGMVLNGLMLVEQFKPILSNAVSMTFSFLTHPQKTLLGLLFGSATQASLDSRFFEVLDHVAAYGYLSDITRAWAERQRAEGTETVTAIQVSELLDKIDRSVLGSFRLSELDSIIHPLYNFFGLAAKERIPSETLEHFFEDRNMLRAANAISGSKASSFSEYELMRLLESVLEGSSTSSSASSEQRPSHHVSPAPEETDYDAFIHELRSAGVPIVPPARIVKRELGQAPIDGGKRQKSEFLVAETLENEIENEVENEYTVTQYSDKSITDLGDDHGRPLLQAIVTPKMRKKFIEKLFNQNEMEYERFVALINQSATWKQASIYVDAVFLRHRINPYSKQAVRFTDLVYSRFMKRDQQ